MIRDNPTHLNNRGKKKNAKNKGKIISKTNKITVTTSNDKQKPKRKNNKGKANKLKNSKYAMSLMKPSLKLGAQIPSLFPLPTIVYRQVHNVSYTVGNLGQFFFVFRPFYLCDTVTDRTPFLYQANAPLTTNIQPFLPGTMKYGIPTGTASAYRLVSCSVETRVNTPLANIQGRFAQAIHTDDASFAPQPNGAVAINLPAEYDSKLTVDGSMHLANAKVGIDNALESVYLPFDTSFLNFLPMNRTRLDMSVSAPDEFLIMGYGVGIYPGSTIEHRIYTNYELEPHSTSFIANLAQQPDDTMDAESVLKGISDLNINATRYVNDNLVNLQKPRFRKGKAQQLLSDANILSGAQDSW